MDRSSSNGCAEMLSKQVLSVALIQIVLFLPWLEGINMICMTKSERLRLTFMKLLSSIRV